MFDEVIKKIESHKAEMLTLTLQTELWKALAKELNDARKILREITPNR